MLQPYGYLGGGNINFGQGLWTYVSGPDATPTFTNATSPTSNVTVDYYGVYRFRYTETNGTCSSSDIVQITFFEDPTANAGIDDERLRQSEHDPGSHGFQLCRSTECQLRQPNLGIRQRPRCHTHLQQSFESDSHRYRKQLRHLSIPVSPRPTAPAVTTIL